MARAGNGGSGQGASGDANTPKRAGGGSGGAGNAGGGRGAKKRKARGPSAVASATSSAAPTPITSQPGTPQPHAQPQVRKAKAKAAKRQPKKPKGQEAGHAPPVNASGGSGASGTGSGSNGVGLTNGQKRQRRKRNRQARLSRNDADGEVRSGGASASPFGIGEEEEAVNSVGSVACERESEQGNGGPGPSTSAARARRSPSTAGQMEFDADFLQLDGDGPGGSAEEGGCAPSAFKAMSRRSILTAIEDLPELTMGLDVEGDGQGLVGSHPSNAESGDVRTSGAAAASDRPNSDSNTRTAFTHGLSHSTPSTAHRTTQARSMPGLATTQVHRAKVDKRLEFGSPAVGGTKVPADGDGAGAGAGAAAAGQEDAGAYTLRSDGLALPAYVEVDADGQVGQDQGDAAEAGDGDSGNLDGVYFVDSEISKGATRYFDPSANMDEANPDSDNNFIANADLSKLCRNCRKPGHHSYQCPHTVCALCGVVDQHVKPDCPFIVTCFNCGKPGHAQVDCPEPKNKAWRCDLCHMTDHRKFNCPTLWRIYTYFSPSDRAARQAERANATDWKAEALGRVADVDYCYNCARDGHLGDDCPERRGSLMKLTQSAFSERIAATGPYASEYRSYTLSSAPQGEHQRFTDTSSSLLEGQDQPFNNAFTVGQVGREKQKEAMRRAEQRASARAGAGAGAGWRDLEDGEWPIDDRMSGMSIRGRGAGARGGRGGASGLHTPLQQQQQQHRAAKRPWDSDPRNGDGYDSGNSSRRGNGNGNGNGDRNMPFGHAHLMTAPAKNRFEHGSAARNGGADNGSPQISFGKISGHSMLSNNQDTPTARGKGQSRQGRGDGNTWDSAPVDKGVAGRRLLVERALGINSTPVSRRGSPVPPSSSSPLTLGRGTDTLGRGRTGTHGRPALGTESNNDGDDSFEMYDGPSPGSSTGAVVDFPNEQSRKKRRRRQPDVPASDADIDYETEWRRSGLGGNGRPSDWAAEDDREDQAYAAAERRARKGQQQGGAGSVDTGSSGSNGNSKTRSKGKSDFAGSTVGQAAQRWLSQNANANASGTGRREGKAKAGGQADDRAKQGPPASSKPPSTPAQGKGKAQGPMYTGGY